VTVTPELLERDRELEVLSGALERTSDGAGGLVLVEGPAGVGKSWLLARGRRSAQSAGVRVLEARGAVLERDFAFGVARQLFEQSVVAAEEGERDALFAGAAQLATRLLGDGRPGAVPPGGDAEFGALHGLYWLTVNLADRGPLLLSVDDAHWSDPSSLRYLAYLSRRVDGLPVLLVVAGRSPDPEGTSLWRELADDPSADVLRPRPLTEEAIAAVIHDGLGAEADPEFRRACHRATGGNPLFVRELVAALSDAGIAPTGEAAGAVTEVGPRAVGRFVLRRLERLGPSATQLSRTVAVLGGETDLALAAAAAQLDPDVARSVADLLVQADVLAPDVRLSFVHPIVQAAVYEDLLPGERAERHLAIARLLDEAGATGERVAAHLIRCAPAGEQHWVEVLRAAAVSADERGAPSAAAAYLRRALQEPPDDRTRPDLLCDLGRWELALQDYEDGEAHLLEALASGAEPAVRARAAMWLSRGAIAWGGPGSAATALDAIDGLLTSTTGDIALGLEAEAVTLCRLHLTLRHLVDERLAALQQRAAGNERFEPIARILVACERTTHGAPAADVADEIEGAVAERPPADAFVLGMAVDTLITTERYEAASRWLDVGIQVARAHGLGAQLASLHTHRAMVALGRGRVGDAELDIQTALDLAGDRHFMLPRIVGVAIQVALERNELVRAAELAQRHGEELARERILVDDYLTARGRLRIARGEVREGLEDLLRCGELQRRYGSSRLMDWPFEAARTLAKLDREQAAELARDGLAAARRFGAPGLLCRALRAAGIVTGGEEGLELLEEAVSVVEPSPSRLEAAYALADLGTELVGRRRRREGREVLRLAIEAAQRCGATALEERIRGALGAGGGRPARLELRGLDALTPAERRVCDFAAGELTNREIAQTLFVTEKTVELHLTNAYRKLEIRSRFQLRSVIPAAD
jgi:DNA-binding CsgD family transcriptional regulator